MSHTLGKNAVTLTVSKAFTIFVSMLSVMLLTRFRTLEEYGTYSQLMIIVNLFAVIFTLGIPNSINYFLARAETPIDRNAFLSVYYSCNLVLCLIMGLTLVITTPWIVKYFDNPAIKDFTFFLFVYPLAYVTIDSLSNVLVVYGKTKKIVVFEFVGAMLSLMTVIAVWLFGGSFQEYMKMFLICNLLLMLWAYTIVWRLELPLHVCFDRQYIIQILKFSIPIGLAGLVGTLSIEIDKLMIGKLFNTEQMAVYSNAARELPISIVGTSLTAVLLPQVARLLKKQEERKAITIWGDAVRLGYSIICFFVMLLFVFAPQMISLLYSEKYLPGVAVFRVYSIVLLFRCTYFGLILNSVGKTKLILYSSIISLCINVILNYGLFLLLGIVGPALATLVCVCVVDLAQLYATAKELHIPVKELMPWKDLFIISLINLILGLLLFTIVQVISLGVDIKGMIIALGMGLVAMVVYYLIMKKPIRDVWRRFNSV